MYADILPNIFKGNQDLTQLSLDSIPTFIINIIEILLILGGGLAVVFIAWSGIRYAASQGDSGAIKDAKAAIVNSLVGLLLSASAYVIVAFVSAQFDHAGQVSNGAGATTAGSLGIPTVSIGGALLTAVHVLNIAVGAISVLFIVIGGVRYVVSNGNSSQVETAKQTITYAIVGLVVSILAAAIVGLVLSKAPR